MTKKMVSLLMIVVLLCVCHPTSAYANQIEDATIKDGYLLEKERINTIEALFAQRSVLAGNIVENWDRIIKIDEMLEKLGVVEISESDLVSKLGGNAVSPMAECPTTNSSTKWTSFRTIYVYQGVQYEIQRITGVANVPEDEVGFVDPDDYTLVSDIHAGVDKVYGAEYASQKLIGFITKKGMEWVAQGTLDAIEDNFPETRGAIAFFEGTIEAIETAQEGRKIYLDALSPTTVFDNVSYTCNISLISNETYVFVKLPGYPDEGHQILAYAGNQVKASVGVSGHAYWAENGNLTAVYLSGATNFTARSAYYGESYQRAVMTYLDYKSGYTITTNHMMYRIDIELFGQLMDNFENDFEGQYTQTGEKVTLTVDVPTDLQVFEDGYY